jgi:hypothetical protein
VGHTLNKALQIAKKLVEIEYYLEVEKVEEYQID